MKVVVTGGCGYIGSVLVPLIIDDFSEKVIVVDKCERGGLSLWPYKNYIDFEFVDLTKGITKSIREADLIIHLAAVVGFPACLANKSYSTEVNVNVTDDIITYMKPEAHLIFASTTSVYGEVKNAHEQSMCKPESLYAQQKLEAENIIRDSFLRHTILRFSTAFGVSPNYRKDLLPHTLVNDAVSNRYMAVFEPNALRSFVHVNDMAKAIIKCYRNEIYGTYNIGSNDNELTKLEIASIVAQHTGALVFTGEFNSDPEKRFNSVSYDKAKNEGFEINTSLNTGIKELVEFHSMYKNE